jgi:transcriptional regulator with GAF, ATPase, and Fis domain
VIANAEGVPVRVVGVTQNITERKKAQEELKNAYEEIKKLNAQLEAENIYLREKVEITDEVGDIIGVSNAIRYVTDRIKQVAQTDATVLLTGETGTGKGLFARALYKFSTRKANPFVHVNCAGLPPNLIESELFGREKGAFTGSTNRQIGRFELAQGGTIFLDEIGELPLELQAKLLKVIEEGELERLGSPYPIKVDVRIIASTNRNLEEEIKKGRFRIDLFYRLNVFPVTIPPLRQRREDILLLVNFFIERFGKKHGKNIKKISHDTIKALENYDWPGNVRELMHVIERAIIVCDGPMLRLSDNIGIRPQFPVKEQMAKDIPPSGKRILVEKEREIILKKEREIILKKEREIILKTLHETGWKIEGKGGAAQIFGMNPSTLRGRMRKLGIKRPSVVFQ